MSRAAGRRRLFRYELRRWPDGITPDFGDAIDSPAREHRRTVATRILELLATIPTPVWGRDEAGVDDMWNSNSVIAWALTRSGIDARSLRPSTGPRSRSACWR